VENRSRVVKKAESIGFSVVDDQEEDGWTALCVRRSGEASRGR
jgi:hypothetical protein